MKHNIQYTLGYLGYFLIYYIALRDLLNQSDVVGGALLLAGSFLILSYIQFLEKGKETPKYSGYIKLVLIILFLFVGFITLI